MGSNLIVQRYVMKMTSNGTTARIILQFETEVIGIKSECTKVTYEDDLKIDKKNISAKMVGSLSNLKIKLL